jgi:hypothetical protein
VSDGAALAAVANAISSTAIIDALIPLYMIQPLPAGYSIDSTLQRYYNRIWLW